MSTNKLERPPSAYNWVRYNYTDEVKTEAELVRFALGVPQITYAAAMPIIRDRIVLGLDRKTALSAAMSKGAAKSRPHVTELVSAFYDYDESRRYSGNPSYDQFVQPFKAGRNILIPVKPLTVIAESGELKPIFVVGWSSMPLDTFQRRLLMTVIEDAVFSLTDFQGSTGEFVSFPKDASKSRRPEVWRRGDYELLSQTELKEQVSLYLRALEAAKAHLLNSFANKKERTPEQPSVSHGSTLFDFSDDS